MPQLSSFNLCIAAIGLTGCLFCCSAVGILVVHFTKIADIEKSGKISKIDEILSSEGVSASNQCEQYNITVYIDGEENEGAPAVEANAEYVDTISSLLSELKVSTRSLD